MIRRLAVAASIGLLLSGQAAVAAEGIRLSTVNGSVMVNQNGRFAPAARGAALRAGDRVVATNGSANLVYADGCTVAIAARSMATVSATSPCANGSSGVQKASFVTQGGDDGGSAGYGDNSDLWLWLGFGVITVVATAVALDDDSDPSSP
jgi:hypothetical protein